MNTYRKIIKNSFNAPINRGETVPPDHFIVKSGHTQGTVELTIARGDCDDAAGIVLTHEEAHSLIASLKEAMEGSYV